MADILNDEKNKCSVVTSSRFLTKILNLNSIWIYCKEYELLMGMFYIISVSQAFII